MEYYKLCPKEWDHNISFLVCQKIVNYASYGKKFVRYVVLNRYSRVSGAYEKEEWAKGTGWKGVELLENQVNILEKYQAEPSLEECISQ